ncbi:MAG: pirin family protein [Leptolyngbyaceae cyanobacterium RU_5_1]|nr:pirin family protein [Leptolyngbyaceae cyanobacterium RU_5_1]
MITIRRAEDRGHADHGWLNSYHSFSFANYYDPRHMGFRSLRVINEDRVAPQGGFPTHPHRDMEIISYIISGSLAHRDTLGNTKVIGPNGVQRFSAGTGIAHSEFNPSATEPAHFLQIWILPEQQGLTPSYEQKTFLPETQQGQWCKLASREATNGAVKIHQDAEIYTTALQAGEQRTYALHLNRYAWVQLIKGEVTLNGHTLNPGDGAAASDEQLLTLKASQDAEVMLFDLV